MIGRPEYTYDLYEEGDDIEALLDQPKPAPPRPAPRKAPRPIAPRRTEHLTMEQPEPVLQPLTGAQKIRKAVSEAAVWIFLGMIMIILLMSYSCYQMHQQMHEIIKLLLTKGITTPAPT